VRNPYHDISTIYPAVLKALTLLVQILYTTICAYAPLPQPHPKLTPSPTLINPNPTNQIKALKRTAVL